MEDEKNETKRSRRSVLRAASAGIVASAGLAGTSAAGNKGGGGKKEAFCHCPPGRKGKNCKTLYLPKKAAKKHKKKHPDDYWGECESSEKKKKKKKKRKKRKKEKEEKEKKEKKK